MVQQWAQFRYGVFDEHGYPGDSLLPYFYRHPNNYDALTSSNNTDINGVLQTYTIKTNKNLDSPTYQFYFLPERMETRVKLKMELFQIKMTAVLSQMHNKQLLLL